MQKTNPKARMEGIQLKINHLQKKIEKLVGLYKELKADFTKLEAENEDLAAEIRALKQENEESEHQINKESELESENHKVLVKARINELVKEIDNCLNMLS